MTVAILGFRLPAPVGAFLLCLAGAPPLRFVIGCMWLSGPDSDLQLALLSPIGGFGFHRVSANSRSHSRSSVSVALESGPRTMGFVERNARRNENVVRIQEKRMFTTQVVYETAVGIKIGQVVNIQFGRILVC